MASAGEDDRVLLWEPAGCAPATSLVPSGGAPAERTPLTFGLDASAERITLAFGPDGSLAAAAGRAVVVWGPGGRGPAVRLSDGTEPVTALVLPDARTLVTAHAPNVNRTWDLTTGRLVRVVRGPEPPGDRPTGDGQLRAHALSPDGRFLAVTGPDGWVVVRETGAVGPPGGAAAPPPLSSFRVGQRAVRAIAFSPDGRSLAVGGYGPVLALHDVRRGVTRELPPSHTATAWSFAFAPDGRTLAAASLDNTMSLWDVASARLKDALKGHGGPVMAVAFAPDGRAVASGGMDMTVKVWDLAGAGSSASFADHAAGVDAIAFSPDGNALASGDRDGRGVIQDAATGRATLALETRPAGLAPAHPSEVHVLADSRDGRAVVAGGWGNPLRLWDPRDGRCLGAFATGTPADDRAVLKAALSPDGSTLASNGADGPVDLWDAGLRPLGHLPSQGRDVKAVAFSPDGRTLASGSLDASTRFWRSAPDADTGARGQPSAGAGGPRRPRR